jgi:hypothetical protein
MSQNPYNQFGQPHICYVPPSPPIPTWTVQQCPRCEGVGAYIVHDEPDSDVECPFCFGVGVVKVRWWDAHVEAVEPPSEPHWHQQRTGRAGGDSR